MKNYIKITKQAGFSYIAMVLVFLFSPLLIFLLTRNLTVNEYGVYSLLSSTKMVATVVLELGLVQFMITKLSGEKRKKKIISFFSINIFELVFLIIILGILSLSLVQKPILSFLKIGDFSVHFNIMLIIIFFSVLIRLYSGYLSADKKLEFVSLVNILRNCLWTAFLLAIFLAFGGFTLKTAMLMWLAGTIISFLAQILYLRKDITDAIKLRIFDSKILKKGLFFSLPLVPAILGNWIIVLGDRYMIAYFMDTAAVGIYSLAYSLVTLIISIGAVAIIIIYPYIAEAWNKKRNHYTLFNISLKYVLLLVVPSIVGLFVMKGQIITLVSGIAYLPAVPLISILVMYPLLALIIELFYKNLLLRNKTKIIGIVYLFGAVLNVMLNLWLIPKIGIYGAAVSTITTYLVMFVIIVVVSRGHFSWDYKYLSIGKILVASTIMGIVVYAINPQIAIIKILTIILGIIIYGLLLFLFNIFVRKEIDIMKHLVKKNLSLIRNLIK